MEANGSGSSSDSAPDCWDQADPEPGSGPVEEAPSPASLDADEPQALGAAFSRHLSLHAKPFVPNVHAAEFVPAFMRSGPGLPPPPPSTPPPPAVPQERSAQSFRGMT
uniref:Uncharacterized protein n=1 Tax=Sphaerodactylus townsendi TaxID=933632 RepID=A0ACB8FKJ6_9SAUR